MQCINTLNILFEIYTTLSQSNILLLQIYIFGRQPRSLSWLVGRVEERSRRSLFSLSSTAISSAQSLTHLAANKMELLEKVVKHWSTPPSPSTISSPSSSSPSSLSGSSGVTGRKNFGQKN